MGPGLRIDLFGYAAAGVAMSSSCFPFAIRQTGRSHLTGVIRHVAAVRVQPIEPAGQGGLEEV